jgi:citrate synthase
MEALIAALEAPLASQRETVRQLIAEHGQEVISEVTIAQAYGGVRGVTTQVCDTSRVDPDLGLLIRERPLKELQHRSPEEMFWLMLTGDLPADAILASLREELRDRAGVPDSVITALRAMPKGSSPMAAQSLALLALQNESTFSPRYVEGLGRDEYWRFFLEDSLNLLAKLPVVTAAAYRILYQDGQLVPLDQDKDWSANFAHMLGLPDPDGHLANALRLYITLHVDHSSGNVSANLCHIAGSALSDPYYAVSAGLNGLAGPLHGMAPRDSLNYQIAIRDHFGGVPSDEELTKFVWDTLNTGRVIPGFGHAVLRKIDPRYTACHEFGQMACPDSDLFRIADQMLRLVPGILKEQGKAKNPYPNVDSMSGTLMHEFGIREPAFYTCVFGISRAVGMCAQLVLNRYLGSPITRPKSATTAGLVKRLADA